MEWLTAWAKKVPHKACINDLTYEEVDASVKALARKLQVYIADEKRLAIYARNAEKTALFILAFMELGKELFLINGHLSKEEAREQARELGISSIFSQDDSFISFEEVESVQGMDYESHLPADEDIAVLMNTSATTGKMKTVPIRWKQIRRHVEASAKTLGVKDDDNWLLCLPMFHVSGLSIIMRTLYNGTALTIMDRYDEDIFIRMLEEKNISMVSMVPTMLRTVIERLETHSLRVLLLGGEYIPEALMEKALESQLPVYKTYGMSETFSQSASFSILEHPDKILSVGQPLPGVSISIHNADREGIGEIYIESPMLMDGYLQQEPLGGVLATGDLGYMDEDHFLYIVNRRTDLIISGGENIYPKEIEDCLYRLKEVKECAIVPKTDEKWGQIPILYIVTTLSEEEIFSYLRSHLAKYKIPKYCYKKDSLPKNASGKILRKELQEEAHAN